MYFLFLLILSGCFLYSLVAAVVWLVKVLVCAIRCWRDRTETLRKLDLWELRRALIRVAIYGGVLVCVFVIFSTLVGIGIANM